VKPIATFAARPGRMGMKSNVRPNLPAAVVGFDDPLEMLLACHRRIEKQLETLKRLRAHLESGPMDAEASRAAQSVLRYFPRSALHHQEDEEKDVFPLLALRIDEPGERSRFDALREELERDHREIESIWARLKKPLEGIAEGLPRVLPASDVHAFVAAYTRHILAEESSLQDLFDRWLNDEDRRELGRSMSARRSEPPPPSTQPDATRRL
jgi:hemerythrin-like domain-containing protein